LYTNCGLVRYKCLKMVRFFSKNYRFPIWIDVVRGSYILDASILLLTCTIGSEMLSKKQFGLVNNICLFYLKYNIDANKIIFDCFQRINTCREIRRRS